MRRADNICKLIKKLRVSASAEMDERIHSDILALAESKKRKPAIHEPSIRSIIMKTKITKLATAAAIIIAGILLVSILNNSTAPAYAIEQTIEAMRKINTVHIFGTDFDGKRYEVWTTINPETGESDNFYMDAPGRGLLAVCTPKEGYLYDKNKNVVTYYKGQRTTTKIRFGRFFEDFMENTLKKNGHIQISKEYDPERAKEVIVVLAETDELTLKAIIDPETNLPLCVDSIGDEEWGPGDVGKSMDEIYYNETLPDGIFEFEVPEGATVMEK